MLKFPVTMEGTPSSRWWRGISRSDLNFGIDIFGQGHSDLKVYLYIYIYMKDTGLKIKKSSASDKIKLHIWLW
jgi:hypothetical protein